MVIYGWWVAPCYNASDECTQCNIFQAVYGIPAVATLCAFLNVEVMGKHGDMLS